MVGIVVRIGRGGVWVCRVGRSGTGVIETFVVDVSKRAAASAAATDAAANSTDAAAGAAATAVDVPALNPGKMLRRQEPQKKSDAPEDAERKGDKGRFAMELQVCVSETQPQ